MIFDVSFSFPGEKRSDVLTVLNKLKEKHPNYCIFYDDDYTSQLAIPNLDIVLHKIYSKQSRLLCVFLCKEYEKKEWCRLEWKAIRSIINSRKEDQIMYLRFDDATISGVFSNDGYIDIKKYSIDRIVQFINERVLLLE